MPNPSFTLMTPTTSDAQRIAQVVQAMAKEAGFDVKIQSTEFATSLNLADKGQFEAYVLAWSGRADPDGNLLQLPRLQAAAQLRRLLQAGGRRAASTRRAPRAIRPSAQKLFEQIAADRRSRTGRSSTCSTATGCGRTARSSPALRTVPDGMVRVQGLKMN